MCVYLSIADSTYRRHSFNIDRGGRGAGGPAWRQQMCIYLSNTGTKVRRAGGRRITCGLRRLLRAIVAPCACLARTCCHGRTRAMRRKMLRSPAPVRQLSPGARAADICMSARCALLSVHPSCAWFCQQAAKPPPKPAGCGAGLCALKPLVATRDAPTYRAIIREKRCHTMLLLAPVSRQPSQPLPWCVCIFSWVKTTR